MAGLGDWDRGALRRRFMDIRRLSEGLCSGLENEDLVVQASSDASPLKWHLGHTSWALESFVLRPQGSSYRPPDPLYDYIFNSYYESLGPQFSRPERGTLSRPTVREVQDYRRQVDEAVLAHLDGVQGEELRTFAQALELALHHEQQHQELMLMDLKCAFAANPLRPVYREDAAVVASEVGVDSRGFVDIAGGVVEIGYGGEGFSFDNELPRHQVLLQDYRLARSLVSNGEYLAFMEDGGYERPELWLSDGWALVRSQGWEAPGYWERRGEGEWRHMTLGGMRPVVEGWPVVHLSFYEADAYARWAGHRLPTEFEWEHAVALFGADAARGTMLEDEALHPVARAGTGPLRHLLGEVWEWTSSAYLPYPGFEPLPGAPREYNGKFMSGQMVLRGGCCATPRSHIRASYRNFFQPEKRWQFSGLRLASNP